MSPERKPSLKPTKNQEEMQRRLHARPTFDSVYTIMDLGVKDLQDQTEHLLLLNNRMFLREYFEAVLSTTVGKHKKMRRWKNEYEPQGKPIYDEGLVKYMGRIRSSVLDPKPRRR